jgi:hypothetical protein
MMHQFNHSIPAEVIISVKYRISEERVFTLNIRVVNQISNHRNGSQVDELSVKEITET